MTPRGTDQPAGPSSPAQRWAALLAHRDSLVRLARRRGAGNDAEDIAQEAMLRAAVRPELDLARVKSYLAKIVTNLVTDLHRRAAKEETLRLHAGLLPRPPDADEEVEQRQLAQHAARLVSGLAPDVRRILSRRGDGASWPQISAELGERRAAIEMRYRRAVLPLRQQLAAR